MCEEEGRGGGLVEVWRGELEVLVSVLRGKERVAVDLEMCEGRSCL